MKLELDDPELRRAHRDLAPHARVLLDRCCDYALGLHADEAGPEHLLSTLMADEECAAHQAVMHAFADPETISEEALAISPGILVSGSRSSTPFSTRGVRALDHARRRASQAGHREVAPAHLLEAAEAELERDLRGAFEEAGWTPDGLAARLAALPTGGAVAAGGPLFRFFSDEAKRTLTAAARSARTAGDPSISPAHLLLTCLQSAPELGRDAGLSFSRARLLLRARTADLSAPERQSLAPDESLEVLLRGLPTAAGSLEMLGQMHRGGTPELAQILIRHKITAALLERVAGAFRDPESDS